MSGGNVKYIALLMKLPLVEIYGRLFAGQYNYIPHKFLLHSFLKLFRRLCNFLLLISFCEGFMSPRVIHELNFMFW